MTTSYSKLELTILETLKSRLTFDSRNDSASLNDFHNSLPNAGTFSRDEVSRSVAVLCMEGLIQTSNGVRIVSITREGLLALRSNAN